MQSIQCIICCHYTHALTCDAYPEGIPDEIISGQIDHKKPYKGDNGIQFEGKKL